MAFGSAFKSAWNSATSYARQKTAEVATGAKAVGAKALEKAQMTADKAVAASKWAADMTNKAAKAAADQAAKAAAAAKAQADKAAAAVKAQANKAAVAVKAQANAAKAQAAKAATSVKTQASQALNKAKETFNNVTRHPVVNCTVKATITAIDYANTALGVVADIGKTPDARKKAVDLLKAGGTATRQNLSKLSKTIPQLKPVAKTIGRLTNKKFTAPLLKKIGKVGSKAGYVISPAVELADKVWARHTAGKPMFSKPAIFDYSAAVVRGVGSAAAGALASAAVGAAVGSVVPGPGTAVGFVAGLVAGIAAGYGANKAIGTYVEKPLKDKYFRE